jgi:cobalt-precorrin-5B (C1)-methyltransferase
MKQKKGLKSGFTTGACAAAAAKAATLRLFAGEELKRVEIPLPDRSRAAFEIHGSGMAGEKAWASVIKDAGDDPDVTNRAEISADVRGRKGEGAGDSPIVVKGGQGVGVVTKPGLPVAVGEPAINPVPIRMIREAVWEAICECEVQNGKCKTKDVKLEFPGPNLEVTISVLDGERLAKKTLNSRLGIIGGISILGTSGIVKPVSSEAWCATISMSMDVALAVGLRQVVLSTGRRSERAMMRCLGLPEEAYVMMGDYLRFSVKEAERHGFERIHIAAQWAKMVKIAMGIPQTHVRHGILEVPALVTLLGEMGLDDTFSMEGANTAREVFFRLKAGGRHELIAGICEKARTAVRGLLPGTDVICYLIAYQGGEVIVRTE